MPNTREKIIELLSIGHECPDGRNPFLEESCSTCPYGKAENCGAEMQADHLIANGVTIPVLCDECHLHLKCPTEERFLLAKVKNPYCCLGERKDNGSNI